VYSGLPSVAFFAGVMLLFPLLFPGSGMREDKKGQKATGSKPLYTTVHHCTSPANP
jgi:hypothetical protein